MDKHPADELNEDLIADRLYSERIWNPLEQEPIAAHDLERRGQMLPLELPWLGDRRGRSGRTSSLRGAMGGFWWTTLGIGLGAILGMRFAGIVGLTAGGFFGAWLAARITSRR